MTNPQASFLPEDYLRRKADSRALIINLLLFGGMLTVVVGAFVVTNREDQKVRPVTLRVHQISQSARDLLTKAGGAVELIERVKAAAASAT